MNFAEYKILDKDVNNFTKVIIVILPKIYNSAENCLEVDNIEFIITELLTVYFEGLDEIIPKKELFTDESKAKQFKKDMLYIKKSMQNFPNLETSWVKTKTDNYTKMLIPESLISKKKNK